MQSPYRIQNLNLIKTISRDNILTTDHNVQLAVDFLNDLISFKSLPCFIFCNGKKLFTKDYLNTIINEIYSDTDHIFYDTLNNKFTAEQNKFSELTFFSFKEILSTISFFVKKDEMRLLDISESVIEESICIAGEHAQIIYDLSPTFILNQTMNEQDFTNLYLNTKY